MITLRKYFDTNELHPINNDVEHFGNEMYIRNTGIQLDPHIVFVRDRFSVVEGMEINSTDRNGNVVSY